MAQEQLDMKLHFDPKSDVLYCSLGEPQEAIGVETEGGVIVRLNPETDEVVGFTILDFVRRFEQCTNTLSIPMGKHATTISR